MTKFKTEVVDKLVDSKSKISLFNKSDKYIEKFNFSEHLPKEYRFIKEKFGSPSGLSTSPDDILWKNSDLKDEDKKLTLRGAFLRLIDKEVDDEKPSRGEGIKITSNDFKLMVSEYSYNVDKLISTLQMRKPNIDNIKLEINKLVEGEKNSLILLITSTQKQIDKLVDGITNLNKITIDSFKKHIKELRMQCENYSKTLMSLKRNSTNERHITEIGFITETNPAGTPWKEERLPESSGSNTIYKKYILGGGVPPIGIEEFSYPTQKSVRSRNAAVARRLILLLSAQKPVEEEDKTESKYSQNAPDLAEVVKQVAFLGKTGVRFYKTFKTSSNGRKKRAFARAADCYGAIPVVLGATLANLEAGFAFDKNYKREAIRRHTLI